MAKKAEDKYCIEIRDVGPVVSHTLKIEPGVTVITGANEVGKSTLIMATAALAGRKEAELSVRDGCKSGMEVTWDNGSVSKCLSYLVESV